MPLLSTGTSFGGSSGLDMGRIDKWMKYLEKLKGMKGESTLMESGPGSDLIDRWRTRNIEEKNKEIEYRKAMFPHYYNQRKV